MRYLLFFLMVFFVAGATAQPAVKPVPGVFTYNVWVGNDYHKVSSSGNSVALKRTYTFYSFFDVKKLVITNTSKDLNLPWISPDHRYMFNNQSFEHQQNEKGGSWYVSELTSAGVSTDTMIRRIKTDHYAIGMDEQNNFIATYIWYDSLKAHILGMKGLYKLDRLTGKILQTLRSDTLFSCNDRHNSCRLPVYYLQRKYPAISNRTFGEQIDILPFGETKRIIIPAHNYNTVKTDSLFVFTIGDSTLLYKSLTIFNVRSGEQVAKKWYTRKDGEVMEFENFRNKMYRFSPAAGTITEETSVKDSIIITKTWDVASSVNLAKSQYWSLAVTPGPNFFIAPVYMTKGEAEGVLANSAFLLTGTTAKISWQVYPFFNRTPQEIAEMDAYWKKINAEREKRNRPEDLCAQRWNVPKYKKGLTILWGDSYVIMADYDCKNDKYRLWSPQQRYSRDESHILDAKYYDVSGTGLREELLPPSDKQWQTCRTCDGDGSYDVTEYTTKTKELPWGYFSGIETKKITTTSITKSRLCNYCHGQGVVLK